MKKSELVRIIENTVRKILKEDVRKELSTMQRAAIEYGKSKGFKFIGHDKGEYSDDIILVSKDDKIYIKKDGKDHSGLDYRKAIDGYWVDPSGGTHSPNEDDPASMYENTNDNYFSEIQVEDIRGLFKTINSETTGETQEIISLMNEWNPPYSDDLLDKFYKISHKYRGYIGDRMSDKQLCNAVNKDIKKQVNESKFVSKSGDKIPIDDEYKRTFDNDDYGFFSDMYKEYNGFRPRMPKNELIDWVNNHYVVRGNRYIKK